MQMLLILLALHNLLFTDRFHSISDSRLVGLLHIDILPPTVSVEKKYYDCELENEAYDIARECNIGRLDFNYVGTNNATLKGDHYPFNIIPKIVNLWWKTALQGGNLVHLTPSERNEPMIPFLQMANGKTNRLGCAYHVCSEDSDDDDDEDAESFVLFVCKYGEENIRIGQPIYTSGPPCGSCRNKCTFNNRLCDI
ncbi:SCP-like protein [Dictyocaulus viviparus]|uniref:SCP-like protein n=1 Tax=Dictyocaulus viviparus TaxID=29172 RepID=A0A0D8Y861_DICVI|nr:SCP-like protein [Dictyocaulus viviparus]